jgi:hypothetical protein
MVFFKFDYYLNFSKPHYKSVKINNLFEIYEIEVKRKNKNKKKR